MRSISRFSTALALAMLLATVSGQSRADILGVLDDLYGGDGVVIDIEFSALTGGGQPDPARAFQYQAASIAQFRSLQEEVRQQFRPYEPTAPQGGLTYDFVEGEFVRTTNSLGPIIGERANTIGRMRLNVGLTFATRDLRLLNGEDSGGLFFAVPDGAGPMSDRLFTSIDLQVDTDVLQTHAIFGITQRWEAGIIVPIVRNRVFARALSVTDEDEQFFKQLFFCSDNSRDVERAEATLNMTLSCGPGEDTPESTVERETGWGIGDIVLRSKYHFLDAGPILPDMAVVLETKLATGKASKLRGDGAYDWTGVLVMSKTLEERFTPHANVGVQATTGGDEFHAFLYEIGYDLALFSWATLAMDLIGRHEFVRDGFSDDLVDFAVGARVHPWRKLVLFGNATTPLNRDTGFRPRVAYQLGFEYLF